MYRGHYRILLGEGEISKIEKMLKEKWRVKDIETKRYPRWWEIHFSTDDRKKAFGLEKIVRKYKGKVLKRWVDVVDE